MKITYRQKGIPFDFKRIDSIKFENVQGLAFTSGELLYFKKNTFNYFVIDKNDVIKIEA